MKKFIHGFISLILNLIWFSIWVYAAIISTNIPVKISDRQFTLTILGMISFLIIISFYILKYCIVPKVTCILMIPQLLLWFILFKNDSLVLIQTPYDVLNSNIASSGLVISTVILFFASRRIVVCKKLKRMEKLRSISKKRTNPLIKTPHKETKVS